MTRGVRITKPVIVSKDLEIIIRLLAVIIRATEANNVLEKISCEYETGTLFLYFNNERAYKIAAIHKKSRIEVIREIINKACEVTRKWKLQEEKAKKSIMQN